MFSTALRPHSRISAALFDRFSRVCLWVVGIAWTRRRPKTIQHQEPGATSMVQNLYSSDAEPDSKLRPPLTGLKQRYRDGFRSKNHHVPAFSVERATNAPHQRLPSTKSTTTTTTTAMAATAKNSASLKDEALYLADILHSRLADSARNRGGRGLLSRALAREELDQFLVAFFSDPANVHYAREKVTKLCVWIALSSYACSYSFVAW